MSDGVRQPAQEPEPTAFDPCPHVQVELVVPDDGEAPVVLRQASSTVWMSRP